MISPTFKFVSYLGGSGGDFFVSSVNGNSLSLAINGRQINKNSLKPYEDLLKKNPEKLNELLTNFTPGYISTHMFSLLLDQGVDVTSIVIQDPVVQKKIIFRQMYLQRLSITVDHTHTFFKIIKNLCNKQRYTSAAEIWFKMAENRWLNSMEHRIKNNTVKQLNFDKLFCHNFVNSIRNQNWCDNLDQLETNHEIWLEKNQEFSFEKTIDSMVLKLKSMDWDKSEGVIKFNALPVH